MKGSGKEANGEGNKKEEERKRGSRKCEERGMKRSRSRGEDGEEE